MRVIAIQTKTLGEYHPDLAYALGKLGTMYEIVGRYAEAESYLQRSLAIREQKLGVDSALVTDNLSHLGALYENMGLFAKAEQQYRRALKISEAKLSHDDRQVTYALNVLGEIQVRAKQFSQAEEVLLRSLKIGETKLGAEHINVARTLNDLGTLYRAQGENDQAQPYFERSLKILLGKLGPKDPRVAEARNELGNLLIARRQFDAAERHFKQSLTAMEADLGDDHIHVADCLHGLAVIHASTKHIEAAADDFDRARKITRQYVARVLPMLSDRDQLVFLGSKDEERFHAALSLSWGHPTDALLAERCAGWLANGKSVAQESLSQAAGSEHDVNNPKLKELVVNLNATRAHLARLTTTVPEAGKASEQRLEMNRLGDAERELAKQLNREGGKAAPADWVSIGEIRHRLPPDALLIDFIRFEPFDFSAPQAVDRTPSPRYAAWITPAAGDARVVDLGDATKIDTAVAKFQAAFAPCQSVDKDQNPLQTLGEPAAEKQLRATLAELGQLILEPLKPHLQDKSEVVLSPDAALWLVPWAALPVGDQYALENWNIRYVTSARDLVADVGKHSDHPPRIFANPDFNLPVGDVPQVLASVYGRPLANPVAAAERGALLADDELHSRSSSTLGAAALLPGTAQEAAAITPNLKTFANAEPKLYADKAALEGVFKHLAAPRVLVVATHGFFLPDQKHDRASATENPLLRCGLLLASCNDRGNLPKNSLLDDGILTGQEIVGTDLRGTELVVLSACETGLGEVNRGQGVAGLRQAFQLAGAHAVVSTLWRIPDQATAQLMNDFFANLAAGQSKSAALRNAQLARIKARREKYGAAHPLFWAAFTLTGQ